MQPLNVLSVGLLVACVGDVTGILSSSPPSINGLLTVCPGDDIAIECVHENDDSGVTRWIVSGGDSLSVNCVESFAHGSTNPPDDMCGVFDITDISGSSSPTVFSSIARVMATAVLNGAVVQCFSSGLDNGLIGSVTINVLEIATPTIESVEQVSQSSVRVNMSVADTQCVANYRVDATPVGTGPPPAVTTSAAPSVNVTGLDVCQYNYTIVGSTVTAGGVQSNMSQSMSFSADLSVVNGITVTVNQMDPLIEWEQMPNPDYPTCITNYTVTAQNNDTLNATFSAETRSVTAQQLYEEGFPFCITIRPVVTPITPITPLMSVIGSSDTIVRNPDFPSPMLNSMFSLRLANESLNETEDTVVLTITIQNVSEALVPMRSYQYTFDSATSAMISFNGSYFEIELPGAVGGEEVEVTVSFQNMDCTDMTQATFTVPDMTVDEVDNEVSDDTSITVTITLPLTEFEPDQLQIISTIEPFVDDPIVADFAGPGLQYTVTIDGLDPDTQYMYAIRIVLRADNTIDAVNPVTGAIATAPTTPPTTEPPSRRPAGCTGGCIAGIVIAIIVVFVVIVVVVVVIFLVLRHRESVAGKKPSGQEMEEQRPKACQPETELRGSIYEEPDNVRTEPNTEGNLAYGHVSHSTPSQPPVYEEPENWNSDPHTQDNVAYGHVQPPRSR